VKKSLNPPATTFVTEPSDKILSALAIAADTDLLHTLGYQKQQSSSQPTTKSATFLEEFDE